jgi:hypothetical protein
MTYHAQQALIDKISTIPDFLLVTNSSFSPTDQTIMSQTPAVCVIPGEAEYENIISGNYLIVHEFYEIHVVIQHETNDANHTLTEALAGGLLSKVLTVVNKYRPTGYTDGFSPVKRLRPQYFETEGFAVFTLVVSIKTIS